MNLNTNQKLAVAGIVSALVLAGVALYLYQDFQAQTDRRESEAVARAEAVREADANARYYEQKRIAEAAAESSRWSLFKRDPAVDAMERANDIAEEANRQRRMEMVMPPLRSAPIVVPPLPPLPDFRQQQALDDIADELRRARINDEFNRLR